MLFQSGALYVSAVFVGCGFVGVCVVVVGGVVVVVVGRGRC